MKKTIFCLIIISVFSIYVYWTGLTQRRIEPDTFGILQTKTNGLIEKPLLFGEKNWNWQYLLPTNASLKLFSIEPHIQSHTISGELPSGKLYSSIYDTNYSFDYQFTFNIAVTISPEAVVQLYKNNQVTDNESLKTYLDCAGKTVAQLAANYLLEKAESTQDFRIESLRKDELLRNIKLYKDFPSVEIFSIAVESSKIPDYSLYEKMKNNYSPVNINQNSTLKDEQND